MGHPHQNEVSEPGHVPDRFVDRRNPPGGSIRFDKTVNVANILTMLTFTVGLIGFGMNTYGELFSAIAKSQHDIANISERLARAETNISNVRTETTSNINSVRTENANFLNQFRGEIRQDLGEIRSGLNTVVVRMSDIPRATVK